MVARGGVVHASGTGRHKGVPYDGAGRSAWRSSRSPRVGRRPTSRSWPGRTTVRPMRCCRTSSLRHPRLNVGGLSKTSSGRGPVPLRSVDVLMVTVYVDPPGAPEPGIRGHRPRSVVREPAHVRLFHVAGHDARILRQEVGHLDAAVVSRMSESQLARVKSDFVVVVGGPGIRGGDPGGRPAP